MTSSIGLGTLVAVQRAWAFKELRENSMAKGIAPFFGDHLSQLAIETSPSGVLIIGSAGVIVFANRRATLLFGYSREELVGQSVETLVPAGVPDGHTSAHVRQNAHADNPSYESKPGVFGRRKDGSAISVDVTLNPFELHGEMMVLAHLVDATDHRLVRTEAQTAQQRLVQAERLAAIGEMVTGLSHETRNALQRARASLDLLELDVHPDSDHAGLTSRIRSALVDLQRSYEEVKTYAAPIVLSRVRANLLDLSSEAFDEIASNYPDVQHQIEVLTNREQAFARIDAPRIKTAIRSIMDNALSAAKPAAHLRVECADDQINECAAIAVKISDQSGGLENEPASRLFEPFYTTKQHGTGLGLAICRRIVEAHGGTIGATNNDQGGTTCCLTLPMIL
jgi:two-component system sensor kinase FixL